MTTAAEHQRAYVARHPERAKAAGQRWYAKNREAICRKQNEARNRRIAANKAEIQRLLGTACVQCGNDDRRVLEIDHINGGGGKMRKGINTDERYRLMLEEAKAGLLQMLCANCHRIKSGEENGWF